MNRIRCHNCGELGHKSTYCQEEPLSQEEKIRVLADDPDYNKQNMTVLCFKCKHYGHYANVCPLKGQQGLDNPPGFQPPRALVEPMEIYENETITAP